MKARVYSYEKCSTCRDALKFLKAQKIPHEVIPIKDKPPAKADLKTMLQHVGSLRKLFNTSGLVYKAKNLKERMDTLTEDEAFAMLADEGMLVKRPFVLTKKGGAVGFKTDEWKKLFL